MILPVRSQNLIPLVFVYKPQSIHKVSYFLIFLGTTAGPGAAAILILETIMVLKVDLQCHKCYKKVKKVLCKFPQIQDQIYDEKQNQVVIKVVCCSPEKIRDRIRCKGGGAIKCIQIKEKPKEEKPKEEKPKEEKPKTPPPNRGPPCVPVGGYPVNGNACCMDCYHGHPGGPCQTGYGGVALYIQYDGYYGRPVCGSYGGVRSYNTNYCVARSDCFSEENPQGCTVM